MCVSSFHSLTGTQTRRGDKLGKCHPLTFTFSEGLAGLWRRFLIVSREQCLWGSPALHPGSGTLAEALSSPCREVHPAPCPFTRGHPRPSAHSTAVSGVPCLPPAVPALSSGPRSGVPCGSCRCHQGSTQPRESEGQAPLSELGRFNLV